MQLDSFIRSMERRIQEILDANPPPPYNPEDGYNYDGLPDEIEVLGSGTHGLSWGYDPEVAEPFVTVGYNLPHDGHVFAEIEDGTYGQLQGIRIYYEAIDD